jgi:hypothetical protein
MIIKISIGSDQLFRKQTALNGSPGDTSKGFNDAPEKTGNG